MQALSIPCSVNLIGITSALCELVMRYNAMTPSLSHGIGTYDIVWTILDYSWQTLLYVLPQERLHLKP